MSESAKLISKFKDEGIAYHNLSEKEKSLLPSLIESGSVSDDIINWIISSLTSQIRRTAFMTMTGEDMKVLETLVRMKIYTHTSVFISQYRMYQADRKKLQPIIEYILLEKIKTEGIDSLSSTESLILSDILPGNKKIYQELWNIYKATNSLTISKMFLKKENRLGAGKYGTVYAIPEIDIVVKKFEATDILNYSNLREIAALKKMQGADNIVQLVHFDPNNVAVYLDRYNQSLIDLRVRQTEKKQPIPPDTIRYIMASLLNGLNELSNAEIYHRDLKPHNILLGKSTDKSDMSVAIADFGLSRYGFVENEALTDKDSKDYNIAFTCNIITLFYRSPEILYRQVVKKMELDNLLYELEKEGAYGNVEEEAKHLVDSAKTKEDRASAMDLLDRIERTKLRYEGNELNVQLGRYTKRGETIYKEYKAKKSDDRVCLYNKASDMWSLGCIFAEMLKGGYVFPGKDETEQLQMYFNEFGEGPYDFEKIDMVRKDDDPLLEMKKYGEDVSDLLLKMLEMDPTKRITVEKALEHRYFKNSYPLLKPSLDLYEKAVKGDEAMKGNLDLIDKDRKDIIEYTIQQCRLLNASEQAIFSAILYYDTYLMKRGSIKDDFADVIKACICIALRVFDRINLSLNGIVEKCKDILGVMDFDLYKTTEYSYLISTLQNLTSSEEYKKDPIEKFDTFFQGIVDNILKCLQFSASRRYPKQTVVDTCIATQVKFYNKKYPIVERINENILDLLQK